MYARFVCLSTAILFGTLVGGAHNTASRSPHEAGRRSLSKRSYTITDYFQGYDFLDPSKWTFFTGADPTNGNVNYVSMQDAESGGLAYVDSTTGVTVLAVDSQTSVPAGGNRNSVRVTSNKQYTGGLFILDAAAMPVGCGTWPSFWTNGPNWPVSGEIDIVEGINDQIYNQMTLHSGTSNPCSIDMNSQFSGHVLNQNCYSTQSADAGCSITDGSSTSFGYGFNDAGGGVFALLWDTVGGTGMSIWHFARSDIPADITSGTPTPANWGEATGVWSSATCDISANFYQHSMIIDTTICGGWAGGAYGSSGCPGTCSEMVANSTNFADAKWEINYVAVYQ